MLSSVELYVYMYVYACVCIHMCMHAYTCVVYVYIVMNVYVHMHVHTVGSPADPPFRNQAHTWSAAEQTGHRVFTTQVSLVTALGKETTQSSSHRLPRGQSTHSDSPRWVSKG